MAFAVFKICFSAGIIALASWLSGKRPELAGFIIALPLMTLLALPFAQAEYHDAANSIRFARSILAAIPVSVSFFIPFLLAGKLQWSFWALYASGIGFLVVGYFIHKWIMSLL